MRRLTVLVAITVALVLSAGWAAAAIQIIDFDAVNLRPANDGSGYAPVLEEYAYAASGFPVDLTGIRAKTESAGQKIYYGTSYFNGWQLKDIARIEFTFKDGLSPVSPYSNVVITDGSGNYGIISSQGGYTLSSETVGDHTTMRRVFYFADGNGNTTPNSYNFKIYEPYPDPTGSPPPWPHGTNVTWDQIKDWYILPTAPRPLSSGEVQFGAPQARGPVEDGLVLTWGDSQNNYIGYREIWDVVVYDTAGNQYWAGVPEPASLAIWSLLVTAGLAFAWRRRRRAG